jgi:hypothetical protein
VFNLRNILIDMFTIIAKILNNVFRWNISINLCKNKNHENWEKIDCN